VTQAATLAGGRDGRKPLAVADVSLLRRKSEALSDLDIDDKLLCHDEAADRSRTLEQSAARP